MATKVNLPAHSTQRNEMAHPANGVRSTAAGSPAQVKTMLECVGVTKNFGDTIAVDEFNLTIPQGEVIALLGPSGCGKTTALRLIAGFSNPEAGSISIGSEPVYEPGRSIPPEKRRVGMVISGRRALPAPHRRTEHRLRPAQRRRPLPASPGSGQPDRAGRPGPTDASRAFRRPTAEGRLGPRPCAPS